MDAVEPGGGGRPLHCICSQGQCRTVAGGVDCFLSDILYYLAGALNVCAQFDKFTLGGRERESIDKQRKQPFLDDRITKALHSGE